MSSIIYCVCRLPESPAPTTLAGVEGRPVYLVAHRKLGAAVSPVALGELQFSLPHLRAYGRVIAALHRRLDLIPMRYGCVLEDDSQVSRLLAERCSSFESLLGELEGCVEMGLRLLLPRHVTGLGGAEPEDDPLTEEPGDSSFLGSARPGLAYLKTRQAHYRRNEVWTREYRYAAQRCLSALQGLFARVKAEGPTRRLPLLSLHFLVRRPLLDEFRQAFQRLNLGDSVRLLLSGPWPPYNFAALSSPGDILPWEAKSTNPASSLAW